MQQFKKWIVLLLCIALAVSIVACDKKPDEPTKTDPAPVESQDPGESETTPAPPPAGDGVTLDNIKLGFVHITDPSDMGYTYNHNLGTEKMQRELGLRDDQIINKFNTPEDAECEAALRELVEQGCHIIFATSFGFEDYVMTVAAEFPDVEFCHASGYQCALSDMPNTHNYFGKIYQARYLSGIAAGLKTENNHLGYVNAFPFAECIQGFTGFYLGAKSVNPDVTMTVMNTNSWNDPQKEAQVAKSLIELGCDVLGQHCDSTAPATAAEAEGVFHVGYNSDMIDAAPNATLTSAIWDWSRYLELAVTNYLEGKAIPKDWGEGLKEGAVDISRLNEALIADGTAEAIEEARARILSGDWDVFTGPLVNADGEVVVAEGDTYYEPASSPAWEHILEGIEMIG
ncbi:MAG: BMP family ABC transporter substrate-binding protein [Clostridiales bacterium]|jgi:basic membrane protein A|nr:BMP family ABC transporter substrate-binding protein [Clostridiales bacterium]MDD2572740.1 BMP family ABC transporter substrate-binding protein [Eubacteriales bacterium]MDY0119143.1 BMP family ABC transporter substrate-binding protein [Clostridia bacterium]NLG29838.1 BMP family ABC transporter substrate-binding protein [Clostridiaceae bacterium]MCK9349919.1 BMP family ABC transporter substrate-binding protein [Clostridiales bacterium]